MDLKKYTNWRIYFLLVAFLSVFFVLVIRLLIIQVKDSWKYKEIAKKQYESKIVLSPQRGNIFDRNMNTLVSNAEFYSFGVDPEVLEDNTTIINLFSVIFGKSKEYYREKLNKESRFVWLERMVHESIAKKIDITKIKGLIRIEEPRRVYLNEEVCCHVLGCTNIDNTGLSGIELQFEQILHGADGYMILQRNGLGKVNPSLDLPRQEPVNGKDIVLTIDLVYQSILDEELAKGAEEFEAEGAMAIMLDPKTGEILALSNYPNFNPNKFSQAKPAQFRNRVITDIFEPGSTFKIVTMAAALDQNIYKPEDKIYCENGKYKTNTGAIITDHEPLGLLTFSEAVQHSSNIYMAKAVKMIGDEQFYKYARNFGFGISTGIELPGEIHGELRKPVEYNKETITYMAFGYGLSATVLQIASAYCAIANKGILMKPHIIDKIIDEDNNVILKSEPQEIRRVVSEKTAQEMTNMFQMVVQKGTGKVANIQGIDIAGKTGTAQKVIDGKYSKESHCGSFVGFVPAVNPKFLLMVLMDAPQKKYYGSDVAAPIFKKVIARIMNFESLKNEDIKNTNQDNRNLIAKVPNILQQKFDIAKEIIEEAGFDFEKVGNGDKVIKQYPAANYNLSKGGTVKIYTINDSSANINSNNIMPSVVGLSIREALQKLNSNYLSITISGSGVIKSQDPVPGERIRRGMKCRLVCEPKSFKFALN
jgi:cell division protein FtsI/penicillin-binding protein 2